MTTETRNTLIGTVGCIIGLVGIGYALGTHSKLSQISNRLGTTIDNLADSVEIDIPEEIVSRAVNKAVSDEAARAVSRATSMAMSEVRSDIQLQALNAVNNEYNCVKATVLQKITDAATRIDMSRVRKDIIEAACEKVVEKIEEDVDDIVEDIVDNLSSSSKLTRTIAKAIAENSDSGAELVFRLN